MYEGFPVLIPQIKWTKFAFTQFGGMEFGQNEGGRLCKQGLNETEEKKSHLSSPEGAQALRGEKWATESKIRGGIVRIT